MRPTVCDSSGPSLPSPTPGSAKSILPLLTQSRASGLAGIMLPGRGQRSLDGERG